MSDTAESLDEQTGDLVVESEELDVEAAEPAEDDGFEDDPKRLIARQKQIDYGKNTKGYENYLRAVPKEKRKRSGPQHDPPTPDITRKCSKKRWEGIVKSWRRHLHKFDDLKFDEPATTAATPGQPGASAPAATPQGGSAASSSKAAKQGRRGSQKRTPQPQQGKQTPQQQQPQLQQQLAQPSDVTPPPQQQQQQHQHSEATPQQRQQHRHAPEGVPERHRPGNDSSNKEGEHCLAPSAHRRAADLPSSSRSRPGEPYNSNRSRLDRHGRGYDSRNSCDRRRDSGYDRRDSQRDRYDRQHDSSIDRRGQGCDSRDRRDSRQHERFDRQRENQRPAFESSDGSTDKGRVHDSRGEHNGRRGRHDITAGRQAERLASQHVGRNGNSELQRSSKCVRYSNVGKSHQQELPHREQSQQPATRGNQATSSADRSWADQVDAAETASDGCYSLSEGEVDPRGDSSSRRPVEGRRSRPSSAQLTPAKRGSSQGVIDRRPLKTLY